MATKPVARSKNYQTKRQKLRVLATQLKNDRQSFDSHMREIGEYFRPRRTRYQTSDRNKGDKRSQKIIDSTPVFAARVCAAGLNSGMTSAARPWFRLTVPDKALNENEEVKLWLEEVRERMSAVLLRSNWYNVLPPYYSDLAVFGTSVLLMEEDDRTTVRFTHFPVGSYWLATDDRQMVRVFMREFDLTVRQVVGQFGQWHGDTLSPANLSREVLTAWENGQTEQAVTVAHFILENLEHNPKRLESKYKRYTSCYYEAASVAKKDGEEVALSESGYDEWPVLAGRWETTAGDVYGTDCPGMTALSDNKALQFGEKLLAMAIEKSVKPPLAAPASMQTRVVNQLPGGMTYFPDGATAAPITPLVDTSRVRIDWLGAEQDKVRGRINEVFFVNLFLLVSSQDDTRQKTATEINAKKEEKLLVLGPVLERNNEDVLDPAIDRLFAIMYRRGELPEPPEELQGVPLRVEYVSVMAQAQKAIGRGGIEAWAAFGAQLATVDPSALDKMDVDETMDRFAETTGIPPSLVRSDEKVAVLRKARAEAAQAKAASEQVASMAGAAKDLAGADMSQNNALTQLLGQGGNGLGATSPQGGI